MSPDSEIRPPVLPGVLAALCVPGQLVGDGGRFAQRVAQTLEGLLGKDLASAWTLSSSLDAPPVILPADHRYPAAIHIQQHHPRWMVCAASLTDSSKGTSIAEALNRFPGHTTLVLLEDERSEGNLATPLPRGDHGATVVLFRSRTDGFERRPENLSLAASLYLYCVWRSYCDANDGNLRTALGLPEGYPEHGLYTIGYGSATVDLDYQTDRLAHRITGEISRDWLRPHWSGDLQPLPDPRDLIEFHLARPDFVLTNGEARPRTNEIVAGDQVVSVGFFKKLPKLPRRRVVGGRAALARLVMAVQRHLALLQFGAMPQVARVLALRSERFAGFVEGEVSRRTTLPQQSPGLFAFLEASVGAVRDWSAALARSEWQTPEHSPPQRLIAKARLGVDRLPNASGGLLRWALLTSALVWLAWGSQILGAFGVTPPGPTTPLPADPRYVAALDSTGGTLLVAVLACWLFAAFRVSRLSTLANRYMLRRFILSATEKTVASLQRVGRDVEGRAEQSLRALDRLKADFASSPEGQRTLPSVGDNAEPLCTGEAFESLIHPRLAQALAHCHSTAVGKIAPEGAFPNLETDTWTRCLADAAADTARGLVLGTTLEQVASVIQPTPADRTTAFRKAVETARKPCYSGANPAAAREFSNAGRGWADARGRADRVELRNIPLPQLAVFAVFPLPSLSAPGAAKPGLVP